MPSVAARVFLLLAALLAKRSIQYSDLPAGVRAQLAPAGITEASFEKIIVSIERDTAERERQGEDEHLIYFILQSSVFTKRPRIEPALSARRFVESQSKLPGDVRARMDDFVGSLGRPAVDERLAYWQKHLGPDRRTVAKLTLPYERAMRFLYRKEFQGGEALYQRRGHSVDTQVEANYGVSTALAVIKGLDSGARLERVLIVGPGLDFAPRTGFRDDIPPQSYQPYLTADSLLRWKLAEPQRLSIQCVDINPMVVDFIEGFPRGKAPVLKLAHAAGEADYLDYFRAAGSQIGAVAGSLGKTIAVRKDLAGRIHAEKLNIITERYDPSPGFDLVIATNVLLYFENAELALALTNVHAMLRPGGYFVHNELRPELESLAKALGLPPIQGRTLEIAKGEKRPLMDAFVIHRKEKGAAR